VSKRRAIRFVFRENTFQPRLSAARQLRATTLATDGFATGATPVPLRAQPLEAIIATWVVPSLRRRVTANVTDMHIASARLLRKALFQG